MHLQGVLRLFPLFERTVAGSPWKLQDGAFVYIPEPRLDDFLLGIAVAQYGDIFQGVIDRQFDLLTPRLLPDAGNRDAVDCQTVCNRKD